MTTLAQIIGFIDEHQILHENVSFQGGQDVFYLDISKDKLPNPDDISENDKEYFADIYGIEVVNGYWGFYTYSPLA